MGTVTAEDEAAAKARLAELATPTLARTVEASTPPAAQESPGASALSSASSNPTPSDNHFARPDRGGYRWPTCERSVGGGGRPRPEHCAGRKVDVARLGIQPARRLGTSVAGTLAQAVRPSDERDAVIRRRAGEFLRLIYAATGLSCGETSDSDTHACCANHSCCFRQIGQRTLAKKTGIDRKVSQSATMSVAIGRPVSGHLIMTEPILGLSASSSDDRKMRRFM